MNLTLIASPFFRHAFCLDDLGGKRIHIKGKESWGIKKQEKQAGRRVRPYLLEKKHEATGIVMLTYVSSSKKQAQQVSYTATQASSPSLSGES